MLKLPDVTLVCVEIRERPLTRLAIDDCLRVAEFGDVLIVTDDAEVFKGLRARIHVVTRWEEPIDWARALWFVVPPLLRTSHMMFIQWDSWICDASMWRQEFLDHDYIGAPWWYKDGKNVGNGGFSLRSSRLVRYLADRSWDYPLTTHVEDDLLCRQYRPGLQGAGFVFAPEALAHQFAFECCRPSATSKHFGFHGMFNWAEVLPHDRLLERVRVAFESPYVRESRMMEAFCKKSPHVIEELLRREAAWRT